MATKFSLDFKGYDFYLRMLTAYNADVQKIAERALTETQKIVQNAVETAIVKPNLPAQGKYSHDALDRSVIRTADITWKGTEAEVPVGFWLYKRKNPNASWDSIWMMYGRKNARTGDVAKVQEIYDAIYGDEVRGEVAAAQHKIFSDALKEVWDGS